LMGEHPVAVGELKIEGSIRPSYYRQDMAQVPRGRTLFEVISELRPRWERRLIRVIWQNSASRVRRLSVAPRHFLAANRLGSHWR
jgi:hypothetical protein